MQEDKRCESVSEYDDKSIWDNWEQEDIICSVLIIILMDYKNSLGWRTYVYDWL